MFCGNYIVSKTVCPAERDTSSPLCFLLCRISRSEASGTFPSSQGSGVHTVSEYMTDELVCEGSEFCFEEVRAEKYFRKLWEQQEKEQSKDGTSEDQLCSGCLWDRRR